MAIMDGVLLGEAVCTSLNLQAAVAVFDKNSMPRCSKAIRSSHFFIAVVHSTGWKLWLATWLLYLFNKFLNRS